MLFFGTSSPYSSLGCNPSPLTIFDSDSLRNSPVDNTEGFVFNNSPVSFPEVGPIIGARNDMIQGLLWGTEDTIWPDDVISLNDNPSIPPPSRFLPSPVPFMMNVVYLQLFATNVQEPKWTQEPLIYDSKPYGNDGGLETAVYHNNGLQTIWLSHQAMFASGEWSIDNVLGDHRLSAALYKHKTAWYGFSKELATCWRWQGEVPSPGKSLTDSITFVHS